jgi:hypothetical protein
MTDRPPVKLLVVLSSTLARAIEVGAMRGIGPREIVWPRSTADLVGHEHLPLYADKSLWKHPAGYDLAEHFAARARGLGRRRARETQLARGRGLPLN